MPRDASPTRSRTLIGPAEAPPIRARSSRNGERDHPGMPGGIKSDRWARSSRIRERLPPESADEVKTGERANVPFTEFSSTVVERLGWCRFNDHRYSRGRCPNSSSFLHLGRVSRLSVFQFGAEALRRSLRFRPREAPFPLRPKLRIIAVTPVPSSVTQVGRPALLAALTVAPDHLEREEVGPSTRPLPNLAKALLPLMPAQISQLPRQK